MLAAGYPDRASSSPEILLFSEFFTQDLTHLKKTPSENSRICTWLLVETIFFKETENITIKISMLKIFLIAE